MAAPGVATLCSGQLATSIATVLSTCYRGMAWWQFLWVDHESILVHLGGRSAQFQLPLFGLIQIDRQLEFE